MTEYLIGRAWKFGDNIDTDQIYPGQYLPLTDKEEMAKHLMEGVRGRENFRQQMSKGDIIVGGRNFGCGSSREHAAVAIVCSRIAVVIAQSFARIFYRNCVNVALPILECEDANEIEEGDRLEVELGTGNIINLTKTRPLKAKPLHPLEMEIMKAGGLLKYLKNKSE